MFLYRGEVGYVPFVIVRAIMEVRCAGNEKRFSRCNSTGRRWSRGRNNRVGI